MKKIKDILYDTNDILVALLILFLAVLIILSRVNAIMAYPEKVIAASAGKGGSIHVAEPSEPSESGDTASQEEGQSVESDSPELYSVYIAYDQPLSKVAKTFVDLGFFDTTGEFTAALTARGADKKVKAGNFIIPENATTDELINIITKSGQ